MTTPGTAPAELDETELRRIETALIHIVRSVMNSAHRANSGLDRAAYIALVVLERHETLRLSELACRLKLDLSTVSRQVKNLEDLGLLQRTEDPDDRRASFITVTEYGRQELNKQRAMRWADISRAIAAMPTNVRGQILDLLDDLATACGSEEELPRKGQR